jgi:DNA-binding NarL/FixJ family response regulator
MKIRVLIADDYFLMREGVKKSLNTLPEVVIVGEAKDNKEMNAMLGKHKPDILLMEMNLCDRPMKGLIEEIKKESANTKVLIISDCNCELPVLISMKAGISGFIRKNVLMDELALAIRSIANGAEYYTPEIKQILANGYFAEQLPQNSFSERELEILRYICKGRSNEQIADILFISEKTVGTHRKNIMRKAGVKKAIDLLVWALDNNLVQR